MVWQFGSPQGSGVKSAALTNSGACAASACTMSPTESGRAALRAIGSVELSTSIRPLVKRGWNEMPRTWRRGMAKRMVSPRKPMVSSVTVIARVLGTPSAPAASIAVSRMLRRSAPRSSRWPSSWTPSNWT